jgi:hypothetical protein
VHERIRLTIITDEETEALHRIEEFDRAGNALPCQLTLRSCRLGRNRDHIANNLKILRRHLAAAIHEVVLELLALSEAFKAGTFDRADVHKHIFAAAFLLDEAEAFLGVEELHRALASADDLRRHAAETAASSAAAARATGAARTTAAATRAAATAEAITAATAETVAAAAEAVTASAKITRGRVTIVTAAKRIKTIFAKTVALVAAAPASPIVTHRSTRTLHTARP